MVKVPEMYGGTKIVLLAVANPGKATVCVAPVPDVTETEANAPLSQTPVPETSPQVRVRVLVTKSTPDVMVAGAMVTAVQVGAVTSAVPAVFKVTEDWKAPMVASL